MSVKQPGRHGQKWPRVFSHLAGSTGNDSGTSNLTAAHVAQTDYYVSPPAGHRWEIHRVIISLEDDKGMEITEFGNAAALSGGIRLVVVRDGVEQVLNPGHAIQNNGDFGHLCYDVQRLTWANTAKEQAVARWTFARMGAPICLMTGDKMIVRFLAGSDTSTLDELHFMFQGVDLSYRD